MHCLPCFQPCNPSLSLWLKHFLLTVPLSLSGNGVRKVIVGQNAFMATPAMSALIRRRSLYGGLIMSASHNPAGPKEDWGIKFNYSSGEPAPAKITDEIFKYTETVSELKMADIPDVDLGAIGVSTFGDFEVEVVSPTEDYFATLKEVPPRPPHIPRCKTCGFCMLGQLIGTTVAGRTL